MPRCSLIVQQNQSGGPDGKNITFITHGEDLMAAGPSGGPAETMKVPTLSQGLAGAHLAVGRRRVPCSQQRACPPKTVWRESLNVKDMGRHPSMSAPCGRWPGGHRSTDGAYRALSSRDPTLYICRYKSFVRCDLQVFFAPLLKMNCVVLSYSTDVCVCLSPASL